MLILLSLLTILIMGHLACMFVLFYNLLMCPSLSSQIVNVLCMSIKQNSHFLERQIILYHSIPFKMWYLYFIYLFLSL
jgi:hypothetical protein